jgi:predicted nuclease with RNAse H fold
VVRTPTVGWSDDRLLEETTIADKAAIDAPFGWPDPFVEAVASYADGGPWPAVDRTTLRYRATDRAIAREGRPPLSVSSDLIAVTAMRCALLLSRLAERGVPVDRAGAGLVVEVYPAAALRAWGFNAGRYKETSGRQARAALVANMVERSTPWLDLSPDCVAICEASDHAFDAVVCALVARASALEATRAIPDDLVPVARREGWIHLPAEGSWTRLAGRRSTD